MKKTQVQIPDHLYYRAKEIAAERELSFAEVVRRGLEYVVRVYLPPQRPGKLASGNHQQFQQIDSNRTVTPFNFEAVREQEPRRATISVTEARALINRPPMQSFDTIYSSNATNPHSNSLSLLNDT
jgi:hypothetical protein